MSSMAFRSGVSEIGRCGTPGQCAIYLAHTGLRDVAARVIDESAGSGIRFALLDAASLFDAYTLATWTGGSPEGRRPSLRDLHVLRASTADELVNLVLPRTPAQLERYDARHLIVVGVPDILCVSSLSARERSRLLGQIKNHFGALTRQGIDISIVCSRPENGGSLLLSSIRTSADRVFEAILDPKAGASFRLVYERSSGSNVHPFPVAPQ